MQDRRNDKLHFGKLFLYAVLILMAAALVIYLICGGFNTSEDSSELSDHDIVYEKINLGFSEHQSTIRFLSACGINEVGDIYSEVLADHPEYFWDKGAHIKLFRLPFVSASFINTEYLCDPAVLPAMERRMNSAVDIIVQKANEYDTDKDKALFVHDYLVSNCAYDEAGYHSGYPKSLSYTCYGCIVNQCAVCQGYAEAYQLILNRLGIECGLIPGTAVYESETSSHAWNYVRLDGEYYMVDVTWDDPLEYSGPIRHDYFCLSEEKMGVDHFPEDGWQLPNS